MRLEELKTGRVSKTLFANEQDENLVPSPKAVTAADDVALEFTMPSPSATLVETQ